MMFRSRRPAAATLITALWLAVAAETASGEVTVFSVSGPDAGSIQGTVDLFRDAVGPFNLPAPGPGPNQPGRREIDWDAVPDAFSDPNPFPGDFFNGDNFPLARGIEFSTPGSGFLLSSTAASGQPVEFGFDDQFSTFSPERLFSAVGSTVVDVDFFLPGTNTRGVTHAFGAVFTDVEVADSTTIELFDLGGNLIRAEEALTNVNAGLSFLGFVVDSGPRIGSVRITSGQNALLSNGLFSTGEGLGDAVVMDDFIFGEAVAVPEPGTFAMLGLGLAGVGGMALRRVRRRS